MRVVEMVGYGGTDVLRVAERPLPEPGPGELRVRVRAVGINPADFKWRSGMIRDRVPLEMPHVLGYDIAGEVDALGEGVDRPVVGTRVVLALDMIRKGGYAEYAVAPAAHAVPVPDGIDLAIAAALPTAGLTGVQLVENYAQPRPGELLLVTGATGAVGRYALHAARRAGVHVVAAVRAAQAEEARALGARSIIVLDGGSPEWAGPPFDAVLDTIGGAAVEPLCRRVKPDGAIFSVATTAIGAEALPVEPVHAIVRNDPARLAALLDDVAAGAITVPVARRLPLAEAAEAHRLVEQGGMRGKVVLEA